jgi:hypothetical protein
MNSPPDRTPTAGPSQADRTPIAPSSRANGRAAATNKASSRWNLKTTQGRRCRDLFQGYLKQLGNPTDTPTVALVIAAAENVTLAEAARGRCLAGMTDLSAEVLIRLENTANRALRRIGLAKASAKPAGPTLTEFLAARTGKGD